MASDVLSEWATAALPLSRSRKSKGKQQRKRRPNVFKIEVVGHDSMGV
jgi:hypothetical protein